MKRENVLDFIEILILLILVVVPIRYFLFQPFLVKGQSMEPNFHNYDYLIIDRISYRFKEPQRGEVIVFRPPFNDHVYYIKRIIGLPGERLIIEGEKIKIFNKENPKGFILNEDYLRGSHTSERIEFTLGPDEYFVLGDNREVSYDSRKWGPIKRDRIVGRVLIHLSFVKLFQALAR
jgi:signal peptidase I